MSVSTWTVTGSKSCRTQFTAKGTRVGLSHQQGPRAMGGVFGKSFGAYRTAMQTARWWRPDVPGAAREAP